MPPLATTSAGAHVCHQAV